MNRAYCIGITGAGGFIGTALRHHLSNAGFSVTALSRNVPGDGCYDQYHAYDIFKTPDPALLSGIDVLIHCAYVPFERGTKVVAVNVRAAKQLIALSQKINIKCIFLSSMSAGTQARSAYGRQKAAIEKVFLDAGGTVLRPGLVLGNGGLFGRIKDNLARNRLIPLLGKQEKQLKTVFVDDLCVAVTKVIQNNLVGCYNLGEENAVAIRDFYTGLSKAFGHEPRFINIPSSLLLMIIKTSEMLHIPLPINRDQVYGLIEMKELPTKEDAEKIGCSFGDYRSSIDRLNIR